MRSDTVKLIIEISKDYYEILKSEVEQNLTDYYPFIVIGNGIPLPKGHGRLIDANKLEYTCNSDECGMLMGCNHCQYHVVTEDEIDKAPTIIEADAEHINRSR